jgi:hypothetical protein
MTRILKSKNPIILLLAILLSGVSLSSVAVAEEELVASVVTFAQLGPIEAVEGDEPITNAATGEGDGEITYSSDDLDVATVDEAGIVTIIGVGTAVITATQAASATHLEGTATFTLNVAAAEEELVASVVTFAQLGPIEAVEGDEPITNAATGEGDGEITYSSDDLDVATVDEAGIVTIIGVGTAVITATQAASATHLEGTATFTLNVAAADDGDSTPPFIVSIGLADSYAEWYGIGDTDDLKIYFSENIEVDTPTSITFQGDDGFNLVFTYVSHEGAEMIVSYTLEEDVTPERIFLASYTVTDFVGGISDEAGNSVDFSDLVISPEIFENNTEDEFFRSVEEISDTWDVIRPVITSGSTTTATENSVITGYTLTATDENLIGEPFAIDGGDDADLFEIDNTTGILSFIAAPDFDTAGDADGNNVYVVTLQAIDVAGNTETKTVSVTLTNDAGDDAPPAPPAPPAPAAASFTPSTPQTPLVLTTTATTIGWGSQVKLTLTGGSGTGVVSYLSTGTTFCAVDRDGNLTPVSAGTCTVRANKAADGTYGSAQSNSITVTATDAPATATTNSVATAATVVVGNAVAGVTTIRFAIADSFAGSSTRVVLVTKNSAGKSIYRILGNATVSATGAVTFRSKVRIPAKAILQLRSAGSVIFSKMVN